MDSVAAKLSKLVREAYITAMHEGIRANTIVLNKKFAKLKGFPLVFDTTYMDIPPMIFALEAFVAEDIPDEFSFSVLESPTTRREQVILQTTKRVRAETARQMQAMIKERCVAGGIYPAFVANVLEQVTKEILEETE